MVIDCIGLHWKWCHITSRVVSLDYTVKKYLGLAFKICIGNGWKWYGNEWISKNDAKYCLGIWYIPESYWWVLKGRNSIMNWEVLEKMCNFINSLIKYLYEPYNSERRLCRGGIMSKTSKAKWRPGMNINFPNIMLVGLLLNSMASERQKTNVSG